MADMAACPKGSITRGTRSCVFVSGSSGASDLCGLRRDPTALGKASWTDHAQPVGLHIEKRCVLIFKKPRPITACHMPLLCLGCTPVVIFLLMLIGWGQGRTLTLEKPVWPSWLGSAAYHQLRSCSHQTLPHSQVLRQHLSLWHPL